MAAGGADHVASAGRKQIMLGLILLPPSLWNGVTHIPTVKRSEPAAAPSPPARAHGVQSWNEVTIQPHDSGLRS